MCDITLRKLTGDIIRTYYLANTFKVNLYAKYFEGIFLIKEYMSISEVSFCLDQFF